MFSSSLYIAADQLTLTWTSFLSVWLPAIVLLVCCLCVHQNDRRLSSIPARALAISPHRWSSALIKRTADELAKSPLSSLPHLPPKTGRRYIVVGGAGLLGGWIVVYLLLRGEDPRRIRIVDIRPPKRRDLTAGKAAQVQFIKVDISDAAAVEAAFNAPWPLSHDEEPADYAHEITVFHTAANIRFYERSPDLLYRSSRVNVDGTRNVIDASISAGANVLVYTSSACVGLRTIPQLLWPWEAQPTHLVQTLDDCDPLMPDSHDHFFSNYAVSKFQGEKLVRQANGRPSGGGVLKTGCLRPGNGVFGPGGDILCERPLDSGRAVSWGTHFLCSCAYVENCVEAHFLYEQRLIEALNGSRNPDISGDRFVITDPNPPPTYGDIHFALGVLGGCATSRVSPTLMILLAHVVELCCCLARRFRTGDNGGAGDVKATEETRFGRLAEVVQLQPALFRMTTVHIACDDARARRAPEEGGLGYKGTFTTLQGVCQTVAVRERLKVGLTGCKSISEGRTTRGKSSEETSEMGESARIL